MITDKDFARSDAINAKRGRRHAEGTCGYMASNCAACQEEQDKDYAIATARLPAPMPGEAPEAWWRRVAGSFRDGWYVACHAAYKRLTV